MSTSLKQVVIQMGRCGELKCSFCNVFANNNFSLFSIDAVKYGENFKPTYSIICKECKYKRTKEKKKLMYEPKIKQKQCKMCLAEFEALNDQQVYCSDKCRSLKNKPYYQEYFKNRRIAKKEERAKTIEPRKCPECETVFHPVLDFNQINKVYCSDKCSKRAEDRRYRARLKERMSKIGPIKIIKRCVCGKDFDCPSLKRVFCSERCRDVTIRYPSGTRECIFCKQEKSAFLFVHHHYCSEECWQKSIAKEEIKTVCHQCNKDFVSNRRGKKYCSFKCSSNAQGDRKKRIGNDKYKERLAQYYQSHKEQWEKYNIKSKKRRVKLKDFVDRIKRMFPCKDCGKKFNEPSGMEFDHCRGHKVIDISHAVKNGNIETLKEEMRKCDLVCVYCHRVREANRRAQKRICEASKSL